MTDHSHPPDDAANGAEPPVAEARARPRRGWVHRIGACRPALPVHPCDPPGGGHHHDGVDRSRSRPAGARSEGRRQLPEARDDDWRAVRASADGHLRGRRPADRRSAPGRSPVPHGQTHRHLARPVRADSARGAVRVGADDRLDDGGGDVAERAAELPAIHAWWAERAEAFRDHRAIGAGDGGRVHLSGPRHALERRGAEPRGDPSRAAPPTTAPPGFPTVR